MKLLFIKPFEDCPGVVIYPFVIHEVWSTTAERAIKEGRAVEVPAGVDEELFTKQIIEELKQKGKK
jgi:hypothetical protein